MRLPEDLARQVPVIDGWIGQGLDNGALADFAADAILIDSDEIEEGYYDFEVILWGTMNFYPYYLEHRNAANGASLYTWL